MTDQLKWYEVLEPSFIGNRFYMAGEIAQFDGDVSENLKEISAREARKRLGQEAEQSEEELFGERERDMSDRESRVTEREQKVLAWEQRLDAREQQLKAREDDQDGEKPLEQQNVAQLRATAAKAGVEVPEGATKVEIRNLIKAKQEAPVNPGSDGAALGSSVEAEEAAKKA